MKVNKSFYLTLFWGIFISIVFDTRMTCGGLAGRDVPVTPNSHPVNPEQEITSSCNLHWGLERWSEGPAAGTRDGVGDPRGLPTAPSQTAGPG